MITNGVEREPTSIGRFMKVKTQVGETIKVVKAYRA